MVVLTALDEDSLFRGNYEEVLFVSFLVNGFAKDLVGVEDIGVRIFLRFLEDRGRDVSRRLLERLCICNVRFQTPFFPL